MSAIEIFDCEQGTAEWYSVRRGMPTASEFSTVLAMGRSGGPSLTRRSYLYKLAGERITGDQMEESYVSKAMQRGKELEPEARSYYEMLTDLAPYRVGFIKNANKGCSPDALIGHDGMLEIKVVMPHTLVEVLETDAVPLEHQPQLHGNLWVAEREWIDLIIYCPKMPAFVRRVHRDEQYIKKIATAVDEFNNELDAVVGRIRAKL